MQSPVADLDTTEKALPWRPAPPVAPERPSSHILTDMTRLLADYHPASDAEALKLLRNAFPDLPLATRLAALAARINGRPELHIPR